MSTRPRPISPGKTEIVRQGLNSAAEQMKRTLVRTAFSPVIYDVYDFAVGIYDREIRLLAQAPSLPQFLGTLSFAVAAAIDGAGGKDELDPGDILLYNVPYGNGSHAQDATVVMPVFLEASEPMGYTAIKAHWLDLGASHPYATDTTDVFQEGTFFPGVKLYRRGQLVDDVHRIVLANTRVPSMVAGDINAEVSGVRTGAKEFARVVGRYGQEVFSAAIESILDQGEASVRRRLESLPDGRYVGRGTMDDDGLTGDLVEFEVHVHVAGSSVRVDYSNAPDASAGPINCPLATTVSSTRMAMMALVGGGEEPNEGCFRPIEVVTRPGSIFHPLSPSPSFLDGWMGEQAMEAIFEAIGRAAPGSVPAGSGGDICAVVFWGTREATGEPWVNGVMAPIGQGAHARGDGANGLVHVCQAATKLTPVEVLESRAPVLVESFELAPDSGGAGLHRGGLGTDLVVRALEDISMTSIVERTKVPPAGLDGGGTARANGATVYAPGTPAQQIGKSTGMRLPRGASLHVRSGGGGGFGSPSERDPEAVREDVREGYVTEAQARRDYGRALIPAGIEGP